MTQLRYVAFPTIIKDVYSSLTLVNLRD